MTLPWETVAGVLPVESGLIYSRTITVRRAPTPTAFGKAGFNALAPAQQGQLNPRFWPALMSGLAASIQVQRIGKDPEEKLPSDARGKSTWRIFTPFILTTLGAQILDRDVVQDDLGRLFHVIAAYTNVLGYDLFSEVMET